MRYRELVHKSTAAFLAGGISQAKIDAFFDRHGPHLQALILAHNAKKADKADVSLIKALAEQGITSEPSEHTPGKRGIVVTGRGRAVGTADAAVGWALVRLLRGERVGDVENHIAAQADYLFESVQRVRRQGHAEAPMAMAWVYPPAHARDSLPFAYKIALHPILGIGLVTISEDGDQPYTRYFRDKRELVGFVKERWRFAKPFAKRVAEEARILLRDAGL
jgi:hypothetical protein